MIKIYSFSILIAGLISLGLIGCVSPKELERVKEERDSFQAELSETREAIGEKEKRIANLEAELEKATSKGEQLSQQFEEACEQRASAEQNLEGARQERDQARDELETANQRISELEEELEAANQRISELEEELEAAKKDKVEKGSASKSLTPGTVVGCVSGTITNWSEDKSGHNVQVWELLPQYARPGRYELSIQHTVPQKEGSFYYTAWTDTDGDGMPDKEIGRSEWTSAEEPGEWTSWEFTAPSDSIFVGNCYPDKNFWGYYSTERPEGYHGLGNVNYYSRTFDKAPTGSAKPRYINIRLKYLGQ